MIRKRRVRKGERAIAVYDYHSSTLSDYRERMLKKQVELATYERASNPDEKVIAKLKADIQKSLERYETMHDFYRKRNFFTE